MDDAIQKCRELGYEDEKIIVDAILCFDDRYEISEWAESLFRYKTAQQVYNRRAEMDAFYYYYEDVVRVVPGFENINFRHLITTD
jgi:hypothetical protein